MSRSKKKTPFVGMSSARSEKDDKVLANRRERRVVRSRLAANPDTDALPDRRHFGNGDLFAKDGKKYAPSWLKPRDLRK